MRREARLRERLTRWVPPGDGEALHRHISEGIYAHALQEDFTHLLLPLARRKRFAISTTPDTEDARTLVRDALAWEADPYRDDLEDVVWDFFRSCAGYLAEYGEVYWELCPREPGGVAFVFVQPWTMKRRWFRKVHVCFAEDGRPNFVAVPENRLVHLRTRDTRALLAARQVLAGPALSHATLSPLLGRELKVPVDLNEITKNQDLAVAQAGVICDWDGRTFFSDRLSELYFVLRLLRFRRRVAGIRASVVDAINSSFEKAAIPVGVNIIGLRSANDYLQIERDLLAGEMPLKAVRDVLFGTASE